MAGFMQFSQKPLENELLPPATGRNYLRQSSSISYNPSSKYSALSGVVSLTYVQNLLETRRVAIPHKLGFTPKCSVWWRDGTSATALNDLSETNIFPLPRSTGNYRRWFYADSENLYILIERRVTGGAGSFVDFYNFEISPDRFGMKPNTTGIMSTL